jgi:Bardet-Biedl syndrome 9 protein
VRLKDRNPVPLSNLELLLTGTYDQLMDLARAAEAAQQQLSFHATRLSAGTRLLLLLLELKFGLTPDEISTLHAHLSPVVLPAHDQGWEEVTYASLAHLLRTALAKPGKEDTVASSSLQTLSRPADAAKLKKSITLVCDRLSKGMRPREAQDDP